VPWCDPCALLTTRTKRNKSRVVPAHSPKRPVPKACRQTRRFYLQSIELLRSVLRFHDTGRCDHATARNDTSPHSAKCPELTAGDVRWPGLPPSGAALFLLESPWW
jgi:hypothetical protein